MRMLLSNGASTDAADKRGVTPAHLCAMHDDVTGFRLLRAHRADCWQEDSEGKSPLRVARHLHRPSRFVRALLLMPMGGDEDSAPVLLGGRDDAESDS